MDELHYRLTIDIDTKYIGQKIEYKYTLQTEDQFNAWSNTEVNSAGRDIQNRTFTIKKQGNTVNDTVPAFKDGKLFNTVTKGTLETFSISMPQYSDKRTRTIRVWLPEGYNPDDTDKKYPVFYMNDGQNLFDVVTSYAGEWCIDEAISDMMKQGYEGAIIVGIDNSSDRWNEYSPDWTNAGLTKPDNPSGDKYAALANNPSGDKYGEFIVNTLKPYIDKHYNVCTDKNSTGIGGSSMGGLISYYLGMKYPDVFGQVLSFSPAFWMYSKETVAMQTDSYDFSNSDNLPKVYFYVGGADEMESDTIPYVNLVYDKMIENGFPESKIKKLTDTGMKHNEAAWKKYFPTAFKWLVSE